MGKPWKDTAHKVSGPLVQIAALVLIGLVFYLGIRSERTGFVREVIDPGFHKLSDPVLNAFRRKPPPVAEIDLVVDSIAMDSLTKLGEQALQERRVLHDGKAVFAGQLRLGERWVPVVIALREGPALPGATKHWPLHVRALPGDTVLGMQTFDVIPVVDEAPLWTMLLHTVLMDQGNAGLNSALAEVALNGKAKGLCILHGRPDATTMAGWSWGNGPVLRFDDALLLDARSLMAQRMFPSTPPPQGDWFSAPLLMHSVESDQAAARRGQRAIRKLEAFRTGEMDASEVFDAHLFARALALSELLGVQSAMDWWDLRFLVDSVSERLVPIPLHITTHAPISSLFAEGPAGARRSVAQGREITMRALADPKINALYIGYLDTFSTPGWWEAELARISARIEPLRKVIHAEHPWIDLDLKIIDHDRTVIRQALYPKELALAYIRDAQNATDGIAVANVHALGIEVIGVVFSEGDTVALAPPIRLDPRERDRPLHYTLLPMALVRDQRVPKEVLVRIAPTLRPQGVHIRTWSTFGAN